MNHLKLMLISVYRCAPVSVATVNEYALKGLDKMEEKLPILHQPADKVSQNNATVKNTFQTLKFVFDFPIQHFIE